MTQLTELNKISIAQIVVYTPALAIATLLAIRHGFGHSSGWLYLVIFSLARILGGALQLATINDPTNMSLLVGANTLQSVGLSPLILVMLGLLSRVLESIRRTRDTVITPMHIRAVQLIVLVGLVLGIIGGSRMGDIITTAVAEGNLDYKMPTETVAGSALMLAAFGLLVIASAMSATQVSAAEPGEKRLLLAIGLATPFVLVRLIFSAIAAFDNNRDFRSFGGTAKYPDLLIGMCVVMEMAAVAIFEAIGLTLQKAPRSAVAGGRVDEGIPLRSRGRNSHSPAKDHHQSGVESV
ncbi:hypothetical protein CONLIGDRAFT_189837 [Coniochaeta ligniaria NRRL 30616]|uniref:DUF7702 domain-containing protein n=1 Tax=Coniochaeta ligniaria NRRL 30616 TaxID=1408157 RepID=A0A1J7J1U1_9PEZI|nr:hypothetical protein CONLIGDRAFT_189837 [Coniochaeta ligniaria NRRL 30616]